MNTCACGTAISGRATWCRRCQCRRAQARYERTQKGCAVNARYRHSDKGRAKNREQNAMRIYAGRTYHGHGESVERARQINLHIKERVLAFKQGQQDRKEAQSAATG